MEDGLWERSRLCRTTYEGVSVFIAVGEGASDSMAYSYDGINWTGLGNALFDWALCVAWNGTMWVAGGSASFGNTLAYSYDGINWIGLGNTVFDSYCEGIAWNGSMWVAVGEGVTNNIAYSYDGINWTGVGLIFEGSYPEGRGVAWHDGLWVAVGSGDDRILYSSDGIVWTAATSAPFDGNGLAIAANDGLWLAGGSQGAPNTLAHSADGDIWTGLGYGTFSVWCNGIFSNGVRWVAAGKGDNTIAYSDDGLNWTGATGETFDWGGFCVVYGVGIWVAGGYDSATGNMLAYSVDGGETWVFSSALMLDVEVSGLAFAPMAHVYTGDVMFE